MSSYLLVSLARWCPVGVSDLRNLYDSGPVEFKLAVTSALGGAVMSTKTASFFNDTQSRHTGI